MAGFFLGQKSEGQPCGEPGKERLVGGGSGLVRADPGCELLSMGAQLGSSGIVLSITATAPILVIPMAAYVEGDKPPPAAVLGSFIAVAGVVLAVLA